MAGMPLYEYKCERCGHQAEYLMGYDTPPPLCEVCDQNLNGADPVEPGMKKLVSRSSFVLKGSGWACDNYGLK